MAKIEIYVVTTLNPKTKEKHYNDFWLLKDFDISKVILLCANCHRLTHRKYL